MEISHTTYLKKQAGFTLIEVLVAVIILALGLIGMAAMQASGLNNNQQAYTRSQVSQLAYDIADRVRSNPYVDGSYLVPAGYVKACPGNNFDANQNCIACTGPTNTCTKENMALKDVYDWLKAVAETVPGGTGTIVKDPVDADVFIVTINWVEKKDWQDAADKAKADTDSTKTEQAKTFTMSFRKE